MFYLDYNCKSSTEYDEELATTVEPTPGLIMTTTMAPGATPQCYHEGKVYEDGDLIYSTQPCQHCYCFRGDIACAVQDCGTPMKTHGKNCTALPPPEGECCPTTYQCGKKQLPLLHCLNAANIPTFAKLVLYKHSLLHRRRWTWWTRYIT